MSAPVVVITAEEALDETDARGSGGGAADDVEEALPGAAPAVRLARNAVTAAEDVPRDASGCLCVWAVVVATAAVFDDDGAECFAATAVPALEALPAASCSSHDSM